MLILHLFITISCTAKVGTTKLKDSSLLCLNVRKGSTITQTRAYIKLQGTLMRPSFLSGTMGFGTAGLLVFCSSSWDQVSLRMHRWLQLSLSSQHQCCQRELYHQHSSRWLTSLQGIQSFPWVLRISLFYQQLFSWQWVISSSGTVFMNENSGMITALLWY